jgi:CheY-like chemotaxis protein
MLGTMLRREGYEAILAGSGEEALGVLAGEPVDLLITDIGMGPSMNGWELAERARSDRPTLPVILATGWGATIDPESARELGICAILSKPYRRADLKAALERVPWPSPDQVADGEAGPQQARAS